MILFARLTFSMICSICRKPRRLGGPRSWLTWASPRHNSAASTMSFLEITKQRRTTWPPALRKGLKTFCGRSDSTATPQCEAACALPYSRSKTAALRRRLTTCGVFFRQRWVKSPATTAHMRRHGRDFCLRWPLPKWGARRNIAALLTNLLTRSVSRGSCRPLTCVVGWHQPAQRWGSAVASSNSWSSSSDAIRWLCRISFLTDAWRRAASDRGSRSWSMPHIPPCRWTIGSICFHG